MFFFPRQDSVTSCKAFLYILTVSFLASLCTHLLKKKDAKDLGQCLILQYLLYNRHLSCISAIQWLWEMNPWGNEMIRPLKFQDVDFMPHTEHLGVGRGKGQKSKSATCSYQTSDVILFFPTLILPGSHMTLTVETASIFLLWISLLLK